MKAILIMLFCLDILKAGAQEVTEKHLSFSGKESIDLNIQIADSINLHTWNKNEVYVTASVNINDNKDNAAYLISFDESGSIVAVNGKIKDKYFKGKNNCCNETDIFWNIYVPEKTGFTLVTINGNVTITGNTGKMNVKSISGYIDLAVPENRTADLEFSTISGTIYSNQDLEQTSKHTGIPTRIFHKMNNGGLPVKLETISGDIFFRKANGELQEPRDKGRSQGLSVNSPVISAFKIFFYLNEKSHSQKATI